jgi:pimeloyl-ACP methyl ester carboxylesterase
MDLMMESTTSNPELGHTLTHGRFTTNYHDEGEGPVVLLLHGSGPGVTAWANWRLAIPDLSRDHRVVAPDIVGFGYTSVDGDAVPDLTMWIEFVTSFLDELGLDRVAVVGNSFGGALALWLASEVPDRVSRIALMGSVGSHFELTAGLDAVWGYQPSLEAMAHLLDVFTFDTAKLPPTLAKARFEASARPEAAALYSSLFPAPRQRWIDALALGDDRLARICQPTLLVHGREDEVIPLASSLSLLVRIDDAELHVFPHCGHWVQIERVVEFCRLVRAHFAEVGDHA